MASQCLLVSMGAIETNTNTKAIPSKMSRWKPSHARMRGLHESDDARVSRSSRGKKSIVSGKTCHRTEVKLGYLFLTPCNLEQILHR